MKILDKRIKIGTLVKINGEFKTVNEIHESRKWLKVAEFAGFFQRGHIEKFKNKKGLRNA